MNIMNKVTLKGLLKNRTRTIVTIIGVILSASMFTAVTTFISSLQQFMIKSTIVEEGDWHAGIYDQTEQEYRLLKEREDLSEVIYSRVLGYATLEGSINDYKPYLKLLEMEEKAFDTFSIQLMEGRLPRNENEIVVSEHANTNGGATFRVGDTLTMDFGQRVTKDGLLINDQTYLVVNEDGKPMEQLVNKTTRSFQIVGICHRLSGKLEEYSAPGYSIITIANPGTLHDEAMVNIYIKANKPKEIFSIMEELTQKQAGTAYDFNYELLRYMGYSNQRSYNSVLYSLAGILILLIMAGSISLIYNSFAISVSERKKQFGMLSSAGATARQRRNSVFFEAFLIAIIGVPIGIVSGVAGIGITLNLLRDKLSSIVATEVPVYLTLSVSVWSIVIAVAVTLATILISAYIPAKRSKKISAMDLIRQSEDIKLTSKKVRTLKLTRKCFGMEGDLALKNLKRNRLRYRSTVISLFISVVLFVAASSFADYLKKSVLNVHENTDYDLTYYTTLNKEDPSEVESFFQEVIKRKGITEGAYIKYLYITAQIPKEKVEVSQYNRMVEQGIIEDGQDFPAEVIICSLDLETYQKYTKKIGIPKEQQGKGVRGILIDKQHFYSDSEERYINRKLLLDESISSLIVSDTMEKEELKIDLGVMAYSSITPYGAPNYSYQNSLLFIIDEEQRSTYLMDFDWMNGNLYFSAKDPFEAEKMIKDVLLQYKMSTSGLFNAAERLQNNRNIITIVEVFSYGFIILISLITIANVFNTISTNVNLRRREFAMLKSVGITNQGFNKMLNFECIFYGIKALIYGLPVSALFTYLIYRSISFGVDMPFYLPVHSIVISIFSVFFVVFVSMMYSMSKIRNENILDALKNENI